MGNSRIKSLIFKLSQGTPVNGISKISAKTRHIKMICSLADFFVRGKSNGDLAMFDIRIALQMGKSRHDGCDPCFIIRAQQGGSITGNDGLANIAFQFRMILGFYNQVICFTKDQVTAVIFRKN